MTTDRVSSEQQQTGEILDVDLLAFERGSAAQRRAVVDGVRRSLTTGFVYTRHDLSSDLLDSAYGMLGEFFAADTDTKQQFVAPGANGQTGYTGLLVETAASSDRADWKEMLNWSVPIPSGHPLRRKYAAAYPEQVLPEAAVPGITEVLMRFNDAVLDVQRRFLRIIAEGIGCHETFFDDMVADGPTLNRAIHYPSMHDVPHDGHVWAAEHGDIDLITALPRATAPGLQVKVDGEWIDAVAPDDQVIINTGIMLERLTNGVIPIGWHRVVADPDQPGDRLSVVQFCHPRPWTILSPVPSCCTPDNPQRFTAVSAADALDEVIYEINLVEEARRLDDTAG
ncbi:MAG: 2-oxoglutarate and iron-dependent oxygenase domain-containing protein [Ilumatobacteraceae bacterium]